MKNLVRCLILFSLSPTLLAQPSAAAEKSQVITYPFPEDLSASDRFHVSVDGQPVFTHATEVADFAMFAIRNVRLTDIQLLEKVPLQSFLINTGGELSGVTFQNVRQGDRVLDSAEDLGLSVEAASDVRFTE
jgi:hypothetical protein